MSTASKRRAPKVALGKRIPAEFRIKSSGYQGTGLKASDRDADGRVKSFTMLAYTGGRLLLAEFDHPVVVDLRGMTVPRKSIPIFRDHDAAQIVGHTTEIKIGRQRIDLSGLISAANECAREVAESAGNGFPWECSIGARASRMIFVERGSSIRVNGQMFNGPIYVATKSVLKETSFVAIGADEDGATATVAASAAKEGIVMTNRFKAWLRAMGYNPKLLKGAKLKTLQASYKKMQRRKQPAGAAEEEGDNALQASGSDDDDDDSDDDDTDGDNDVDAEGDDDDDVQAEGDDDDDVEADGDDDDEKPVKATGSRQKPRTVKASSNPELRRLRQLQAEEAKRVHKINKICAKYPNVELDGQSLAEKAIRAGWSAHRTELAAMRRSRPQAPAGHVKGGRDDLNASAVEASLLLATNHDEKFVGKHYDQKVMNAALSKEYRGFTLHSLMANVIRAAGHHYSGSHKSNDFIRAMKKADRELQASGFSTLRVSNVLENVANKALINSYLSQETVWQEFCARKSYSDFKVQSRYRLDAQGSFKKVGPDGELKHVGLSDARYTNQLDTFGAIITLNRQMMVNDDLDAFLEIPKFLGQMSAIRIEEAFFVLLLSNLNSFFHANNKNLLTGGTSAFSIASLTAMETKFRNQTTPNGKPLLTAPKKILVPTTLAVDSENLFAEKLLIGGVGSAVQPARNPHAGKYAPFVSPYLNNTSITDQDGNAISGQSDTAWYMFADPNVLAAIVIGFLNGQANPIIESDDTPFDTLGMQWRGYQDFGVGFEDPVGAAKSAGA